ncbi:MAG: response regulator [Actinomycetota bacterium]
MKPKRLRVLVVDDEDDIRLIVGLNLGLLGMEFGEAVDGAEALEMLRAGDWDGCVLDLAMPKVDGYTVLKELAKDDVLGDLAVVVLSARGSPTTAIQAMKLGAHAHLTKPFSPAAVARTLLELLSMPAEERQQRRKDLIERASQLERLGMPTV